MLKLHVGYCNSVLFFCGTSLDQICFWKDLCLCTEFSNPCEQKPPKRFAASVSNSYQVNKRDK